MTRRSALIILIAVAALTGFAGWLTLGLRLDYDFEDFFPQDDPATDYYLGFRDAFETDNDFFIVALDRSEGVFDSLFLAQVNRLAEELRGIPDVIQVAGPTDLFEVVRDPLMGGTFRNDPAEVEVSRVYTMRTPRGSTPRRDWSARSSLRTAAPWPFRCGIPKN
jgi:predicted RND superfamily exporter protein